MVRQFPAARCVINLLVATACLEVCSANDAAQPGLKAKAVASSSANDAAVRSAPASLKWVSIPIERANFREGWKKTVPLKAIPGDAFDVWVQNGWLHAKRSNELKGLDWQIILARVSGPDPPNISLVDGAPVFELSYLGGRYFIRDTLNSLRCVRERKGAEHCLPRKTFFGGGAHSMGWGRSKVPQFQKLELSAWQEGEWIFAGSGPDDQRFDVMVRLDPVKDPGRLKKGELGRKRGRHSCRRADLLLSWPHLDLGRR